jgi:hypothetical protein
MVTKTHSMPSVAIFAAAMFTTALAVPAHVGQIRSAGLSSKPFAPIDPQNWVNPDNMTWDDFVAPPTTSWSDPARKGRSRNFNIAMVTVDYPGMWTTMASFDDTFVKAVLRPSISGISAT